MAPPYIDAVAVFLAVLIVMLVLNFAFELVYGAKAF
jgi:hypothetical protein